MRLPDTDITQARWKTILSRL